MEIIKLCVIILMALGWVAGLFMIGKPRVPLNEGTFLVSTVFSMIIVWLILT